ncbi:MAG: HAMP domain-containing histidine kinase [Magnetococcales bacterium]|nr:HAMP domain-containing histidine kinase [Magnetococcales bacterium]
MKALILTISVLLLFWIVLDAQQTEHQRKLFKGYLLEELTKRTYSDWGRFDEQVRSQLRAGKLLVGQQTFVRHIQELETMQWESEAEPSPIVHTVSLPTWLPKRSVFRGLINVSHVLLLDPMGRVREIFQTGQQAIPPDLLNGLMDDMAASNNRNIFRAYEEKPYLLSRISMRGESGSVRATMVLVTTFDDGFLLNMQMQTKSEGVLIFLGPEGKQVSASSRPDLVSSGTLVKELEKDYLMMEKSYFDYGFSTDLFIKFATLIPLSQIQPLSDKISQAGRTQRAVAYVILIALIVTIVVWLVGQIQEFTREMLRFSREQLGLESPKAEGADQILVMKDQFRLLAHEITEARNRESIQEAELRESNKALWESLVMVKRTQSQLVESEKMAALGGLVAGVAHEINTPLGIGITAISFLNRRSLESHQLFTDQQLKKSDLILYLGEMIESSEMILSNLNRAAQLIRSFKQVAVDQASEDRRKIDMKQYVDQVLLSLHHRLAKTTHSVLVSCPDNLEYDGYPGVLSQILTNLIENSLIHGFKDRESGTISIDISFKADEVVFRFKDDGVGISEENRRRIFEPFFTTTRGSGGSGLGMHIVYNLVTQTLKGRVVCHSEPGEGVEFVLTFPLQADGL